MPFPTLTSRRSWLLAGGILASAGLGATAVAGPAWATSASSAPVPISAVTTAAVGGSAARPAQKASSSLAAAKARIEKRIDALVTRIDRATGPAENDPNLAGLVGQLSGLRQQLVDLRKQVAAASDLKTLRSEVQAEVKSVRSDTALQEVAVVLRADRLSVTLGKVGDRVPAIEARLTAAQSRGTDTSQASAALADLQSKLADAQGKLSGLAQNVLSGATSPADARTALQAAQADAKAV
ncbi:MAG TPA: hypothetical protein VFW24_01430, partial [Acidimicrobiales bacterium]|nr:hypothetical protein [Acidimicrobiales bacterium]